MTQYFLEAARLCQSARSTTDIRDQHRESLKTQRHKTRFACMLKKRGLFRDTDEDRSDTSPNTSQDLSADNHVDVWQSVYDTDQDFTETSISRDDFSSDHEASEISESYDEVDLGTSDSWDPSSWFSGSQRYPPRPCHTPSPSLSIASESSHNSLTGSPIPQPRRTRQPRSRHESLLFRKRITCISKDDELVRNRFEELKAFMILNSSKPQILIPTLISRWKTISDAILHQDNDLVYNALNLTKDLVSSHWMRTEDLLFILQQGFLLTLKESLVKSGNHQVDVIKLILAIIRHGPCATPYITELLSNCGLFETFSELFLMGSSTDAQMVALFYSEVFQILSGLAASDNFVPIVPAIIAASSSSQKLSELYDPIKALKQIVQPTLTTPIIYWLFKQIGYIDCETFRISLVLVANFMSFVTFYLQNISSDSEWARSMAETFEFGHVITLITGSMESGSIDQYPGHVKVELERFRDFYSCWTNELSHYLPIC